MLCGQWQTPSENSIVYLGEVLNASIAGEAGNCLGKAHINSLRIVLWSAF
jgi:hypothetical protein